MSDLRIEDAEEATVEAAAWLLVRFFREEGFATPATKILENTRRLAADPQHRIGMAHAAGRAVGVVTVTTARYVEWGGLGEIGDLHVIPELRRRGVATALIGAATARCADLGCAAISVTVTPQGQARHDLEGFYRRFGFAADGRRLLIRALP